MWRYSLSFSSSPRVAASNPAPQLAHRSVQGLQVGQAMREGQEHGAVFARSPEGLPARCWLCSWSPWLSRCLFSPLALHSCVSPWESRNASSFSTEVHTRWTLECCRRNASAHRKYLFFPWPNAGRSGGHSRGGHSSMSLWKQQQQHGPVFRLPQPAEPLVLCALHQHVRTAQLSQCFVRAHFPLLRIGAGSAHHPSPEKGLPSNMHISISLCLQSG